MRELGSELRADMRRIQQGQLDIRKDLAKSTKAILDGMLELADRPMPYFFLLLPKVEAMEKAGKEDAKTFREKFWARCERVHDKITPFESLFVIFPCQSGRTDHSQAEGYSMCVHEPFEVKTPGRVLQAMAPVLKQLNTLLKVTATVGAFAGYPLPKGLPFLESLQNQDQIKFLGEIYDDALRVDKDGALNPSDENQWTQDAHALAEGAAAAADHEVPSREGTRDAYEKMQTIMQKEYPEQYAAAYQNGDVQIKVFGRWAAVASDGLGRWADTRTV